MLLQNKINSESCLCGSDQDYQHCCFLFHNEDSYPETAEQLMRSRYVAYAKQLTPYLLKTWHSAERPDSLTFDKGVVWTKLMIDGKKKGRKKDREGWVAFTAFYKIKFENRQLREKSFFSRDENNHWCYVNGTFF